jgi:hypothetical protein
MGLKGPVFEAQVHRDRKGSNPTANQSIDQSINHSISQLIKYTELNLFAFFESQAG